MLTIDTKFKKEPDDENLVARIVRGWIEIGVYPVAFGMRVRAGFVGAAGCELDWCCGDNQAMLEWAYSSARNIMETREDFEGIPRISDPKPFWLDPDFVASVRALRTEPLQWITLPPIPVLRQHYRFMWEF